MRSRLLPLLVVAALGLTACGTGETTSTGELGDDAPVPAAPVDPSTTEEATDAPDDAPARGESGENPASPDGTVTDAPPASEAEVPMADAETPVVLGFDGRQVPLVEACAGADGAIRATTEGEVTVTLVREDGVALRYEAEDATAETDEVTVDDSRDDTIYTATLSSEQVEPLAVTLAVVTGAEDYLSACQ